MTDDLERTLKILTATSGAKVEWANLARAAIAGAVKWKAERDQLQARIDAASAELDNHDSKCNCEVEIVNRVRPALLGDSESGGN